MKIAMVCYPTYGGSGIIATELGMYLSKLGHEIHFVSNEIPARLVINNNIYFHNVHVEEYPLFKYQPYDLALSSLLYNIYKKHHLDIIHVHYVIPHSYSAYFAKLMIKDNTNKIVPLVTTLHGTDITLVGKHPSYKEVVKFCINKSDIVTSVSNSLKLDTFNFFSINRDIQVIPNFINNNKISNNRLDIFNNNFREKDEKIIVHISNIRRVKRIQDVIKIFYLINKNINSKLLICGDGPDLNIAKNLISDLKISDKVIILGLINDLSKVLKGADLFIMPSSKESFGLSALEAMSYGVPIISSNAGGLPELNKDGLTGYVLDVGDINNMANKAIKLLSNTNLLNNMKLNCIDISKFYDIENIVPKYISLYNKIIF